MIWPPAKTGCMAVSPAMVPFFNIDTLMGLARSASAAAGSDWARAVPSE